MRVLHLSSTGNAAIGERLRQDDETAAKEIMIQIQPLQLADLLALSDVGSASNGD